MIEDEPSPGGKVNPAQRGATSARRYVLTAAALTGLLVLGAVRFGDELPSWIGPQGDEVSQQEILRRVAAFSVMPLLQLRPIAPGEVDGAIAAMELPDGDRKLLADNLAAGRIRLAWLSLYDSDVEDGDAVTVSSDGYSKSIVLTKAPMAIAVPVPSTGRITITGIDRGRSGGVTVGIVTQAGLVPLPPMQVGQTITLTVAAP